VTHGDITGIIDLSRAVANATIDFYLMNEKSSAGCNTDGIRLRSISRKEITQS
jgi:hypothetical protein